jgi:23S rRNA (adenine2030-N6)-methyltransferase
MSLNPTNELRYYPGSPWLARFFIRTEDRMVLSELHPEDIKILKKNMGTDKRIGIHHQDGYVSLKSFLPPKERRGLILIDPPYEKNNEYQELPNQLANALKRFETGVYAVWYPIKSRQQNHLFHQSLQKSIQRPFLTAELCIYADDVAGQLNGSGMIIINPPWQIDQELKNILPWVWENLSINKQGYARVLFHCKNNKL